jgi:tetratricopeptide (TPR) repeat protein/CHAT domain-containing protein
MNLQELLTLLSETEDLTRQREILEQHRELLNPEFIEQGTKQVEAWTKGRRRAAALRLSEVLVTACSVADDLSQLRGKVLFAKAKALDDMERWDEAMEVYEEARRLFEDAKDQEGIADCDFGQGRIYDSRCDFDKAMVLFKRAQAVFEELGRKDRAADCVKNQGNVHGTSGEFDEALACYKRAQAVYEELGRKDGAADCVQNQGSVYCFRGDFDEALVCYKQAQAVYEELGRKDRAAVCVMNHGTVHCSRGEYDEALVCYKQAQAVYEELGRKDGAADCVQNRGEVHRSCGDFDEALVCYKQAQAVYEELGMKDSAAVCMQNQGEVHRSCGDFGAALACYKQAQEIYEALGIKNRAAHCVQNQGEVHRSRGDFDAALACYKQAQAVFEELGIKNLAMDALRGKGDVYRLREEPDAALQCYTQAKEERPIEELWYPEIQWQVRYGIAKLHQSTPQALDYYDESIAIIDTLRGRQQTDWTKMGILHDKEGVYASAIRWCLNRSEEGDYLSKAFNYTERAKSRAFLDLLEQAKRGLKAKDAQTQAKLDELRKIDAQATQEQDDKTRSLRNEIEAQIAQRNFELASLVSVQAKSLSDIQACLPEGTALLEYFYAEEQGFIFGVTKEEICIHKADFREALQLAFEVERDNAQVHHIWPCYDEHFLVDEKGNPKGKDTRVNNLGEAKAVLSELYDEFIRPMQHLVEKVQRLVFVPHGVLHTLPWAALYDDKKEEYLVERKVISLLPSASVLEFCKHKNRNRKESCLALLRPLTTESVQLRHEDNPQDFFRINRVLRHEAATRKNFETEIQRAIYDVVHFDCHGYFNIVSPMYSYLALSNGDVNQPQVEPLYAADLFNLDLSAWLVVLGACEMGKGLT